jgi:hypothetical protein
MLDMKKFFLLLLLSIGLTTISSAGFFDGLEKQSSLEDNVKANDIHFPGNFYTTEINYCEAIGSASFDIDRVIERVEGLVGYDWPADHAENSDSMTVKHQNITRPIGAFMVATHNAIGNGEQDNIQIAKNLLIDLAEADTLHDSFGFYEVKKKGRCYAGGDMHAPCWYHQYEFARGVFSNYMIAALWLKDELNEQEFEIVDKYIRKMYKKFVQPMELRHDDQGIYQMMNGGTSILVYASWTNNKELAAQEINFRFKEMDRLIFEDGYINNNSFRGVRAQWYHSYGLDIALGYVYIADLWGAKIPEKLQNKLVKASEVANLAITDYDKFASRKFDGPNSNKTTGKNNARKHTHQNALAIDTLMKIVTGVELEYDPVYLQKRNVKRFRKIGIDDLIGFNPNCIH